MISKRMKNHIASRKEPMMWCHNSSSGAYISQNRVCTAWNHSKKVRRKHWHIFQIKEKKHLSNHIQKLKKKRKKLISVTIVPLLQKIKKIVYNFSFKKMATLNGKRLDMDPIDILISIKKKVNTWRRGLI